MQSSFFSVDGAPQDFVDDLSHERKRWDEKYIAPGNNPIAWVEKKGPLLRDESGGVTAAMWMKGPPVPASSKDAVRSYDKLVQEAMPRAKQPARPTPPLTPTTPPGTRAAADSAWGPLLRTVTAVNRLERLGNLESEFVNAHNEEIMALEALHKWAGAGGASRTRPAHTYVETTLMRFWPRSLAAARHVPMTHVRLWT